MNSRNQLCICASFLTIAISTSGANPAFAQSDDDGARPTKDSIVVTARKREESLQDVPLSITAISAAAIADAGLQDINDIALQTPGFSFREGFGRAGGDANSRPSIRGMSSILGAPNAGFFVDGVFVSGAINSYQLDNLERVEVLRGPQAAQFGRQTFSGAVNFVTRKPSNEFRGQVTATAAEHSHYEGSGFISGPIIEDVLAAELNGRFYSFGGDYFNNATGEKDIGEQESTNIGTVVQFTPADNLSFTLNTGWSQDKDGGFAYGQFGSSNLNCFLPNETGSFFGIPVADNRSRGYFCGEIETPTDLAWNTDEIDQLGIRSLERTTWRASLITNYELASGYLLTLSTAYNKQTNRNVFDSTLVPSDTPFLSIGRSRLEDFAQEVRFSSPVDNAFRWTVGGYYYSEHAGIGSTASGTFVPSGPSNLPRGFDSGDKVRNIAGFGMLEYDISDRLTATVEGRYQQDKITDTTNVLGTAGTTETPPAIDPRVATFDEFLPRFTLSYGVNDNMNLYANVSKGNKAGGFNDFPDASEFLDPTILDGFLTDFGTFNEESVWSYEVGAKGSVKEGWLNYGLAVYYLDWSNQQLTQSEPFQTSPTAGDTVPFIVNAGASEVYGMELELFGNLTDWFDYRIGYSYTDAEFTDFYDENAEELFDTDGLFSSDPLDVDGPNGQVAGNDLPQTPKHQLTASGTIRHALNSNVELFFRSDYNYESNRWVQAVNLAGTGDSHNLNLRMGADIGNVRVSMFYNNVLDDDTPLVVTRLADFSRPLFVANPLVASNRRFTFFRDFTISGPRKPQFGGEIRVKF